MAFIIDTKGDQEHSVELSEDTEELPPNFKSILKEWGAPSTSKHCLEPKRDRLEDLTDDLGMIQPEKKSEKSYIVRDEKCVKEALKKSVLTPDFERLPAVPPVENKGRKYKKQQQELAARTKGKKWFGMPAPEMTEEIKHDLELIQMRSVLDPKRFYKKNDLKVLPKYFQIGKVMDSPLDYYNNRLTKKERKATLVDELLNDAEFEKYNKRKFKEIITEKQKTHYKSWRQAKRLKKKKN